MSDKARGRSSPLGNSQGNGQWLTLVATTGGKLGLITGLVHDCYFDVDKIEFDEIKGELRIPFDYGADKEARVLRRIWFLSKAETPFLEALLTIHKVKNWALNDTEGIGSYDFNELTFDEKSQTVTVKSNVPLGLSAEVENLQVSVSISDSVVDRQVGWRMFDFRLTT